MIKRTIYLLLGIAAAVFVPYLVGKCLQVKFPVLTLDSRMPEYILTTWYTGALLLMILFGIYTVSYAIYGFIKYGDFK